MKRQALREVADLMASDRTEKWMLLAMGLLGAAFVFAMFGWTIPAIALVCIALAIFLGIPGAVVGTVLLILVAVLT